MAVVIILLLEIVTASVIFLATRPNVCEGAVEGPDFDDFTAFVGRKTIVDIKFSSSEPSCSGNHLYNFDIEA